jgi:hypothetical protein
MDMLGHEHIAKQRKSVPRTNIIQDIYEAVAGTHGSKVGKSPITTEGDEMKITRSIKSPQRIAFRFFHANRQVKTRTLKTEGCGTRYTSRIHQGLVT